METLEEGIGDSVRPKNKFESQRESIQDSCKTSNDVQCRDLAVKKAQEKKLDVAEMMDEWSHQAGQNYELGKEGEEDQIKSKSGWIASETTCRRDNCQGRTRKTGLNGGVS